MTKSKNEITNGVRLENASWRTWAKQRGNLKTISPETLNWLKDSDVTWLYGPLHEKANPVPPPKQATFADRLGLENLPPQPADKHTGRKPRSSKTAAVAIAPPTKRSSTAPSSAQPSAAEYAQSQSRFGPDRRRGSAFPSSRPTPAPKSILKHRTIQDMLTLNIGRRAASPATQPDSMMFNPPTPGSIVSVTSSTSSSSSSAAAAAGGATLSGSQQHQVHGDGPLCIRSDTNLPETGLKAGVEGPVGPSTPTEGATDYLAAVRLSSAPIAASSSVSSSPSASTSIAPPRPALIRTEGTDNSAESGASGSTSGSRRSIVSFEGRGKRPDRHISFNHRVEQCIALDEASSDGPSTFIARSQTPSAFGSNAAIMVPDASSSAARGEQFLQLYEAEQNEDVDDHYVSEEEEEGQHLGNEVEEEEDLDEAGPQLAGGSSSAQVGGVLRHPSQLPAEDEDHSEYVHFRNSAHLGDMDGSQPRMYTGSASSEEDLSTSSSSDGYDSDALTMRSSSVGSVSDSSVGHFSTARDLMTSVGHPKPAGGQDKSRKGSFASSSSSSLPAPVQAMHTIAKLAPTLLKTSEAYPAPSPAVVDPTNFLQTLEHERLSAEQERARQFQPPVGFHFGHPSHSSGAHSYSTTTTSSWAAQSNPMFDPSYFANGASASLGNRQEIYGRSVPVSIPSFGGRDSSERYENRGPYSVSASATTTHQPDYSHYVFDPSSAGPAVSASSYHRLQQGNYHSHGQSHVAQQAEFDEFADDYLDDDDIDIDIDLGLDVDDVDLDLDLDDDDEDEDEYVSPSISYRNFHRQLEDGRRYNAAGGGPGKYAAAADALLRREQEQAAAATQAAQAQADERMQTSVESLRPAQPSGVRR
ncbi:protein phosphatase regulator [Tilletia horrida]|nr:protein phosphatase regulator [Tilletia horrida]